MSVAVLCTGTELLKGSATNTNLAYLGKELTAASMPPVLEMTVGDHPSELAAALGYALSCADVLIISGGLGPTADDLTLDTAARFFGVKLCESEELKEKIRQFWARRHRGFCPRTQFRQARVPENGFVLPNPVGSASGLGFSTVYGGRERLIYLLPGPPREFEPMVRDFLMPDLKTKCGRELFTGGFLACCGESQIFTLVAETLADMPVEVACAAGAGGTRMFVSGRDENVVNAALKKARNAANVLTLPIGNFDMAEYLIRELAEKGLSFGCAESCTGGLIANRFVSVSGASAVFKGAVVAYANDVKMSELKVNAATLDAFGAVSAECASEMALGCCAALGCDCAVSTTGIAGPDGGTPDKPVGLVYVAAAYKGDCVTRELRLNGDRRAIRERAAELALQLIYELIFCGKV